MGKTDQILNHIIDIKGHMGKIDGHLKNLNDKVQRNKEDISYQKKEVKKIRNKMAYWSGGVAVAVIIITFLAQWVFKYKL